MSDAGSGANRADAQHRPREYAPSASDYPPVDVASLGESEANAVRNSAPPAELRVATVGKRARSAAGVAAIRETVRFGAKEMGARRAFRTYLKVNKKDGFDCQSCAWPSPDGKRDLAEFCENGAKAIASEATTKRVTREFFVEHSVDELARQSDQWLNEQGRLTEPMVLRAGSR